MNPPSQQPDQPGPSADTNYVLLEFDKAQSSEDESCQKLPEIKAPIIAAQSQRIEDRGAKVANAEKTQRAQNSTHVLFGNADPTGADHDEDEDEWQWNKANSFEEGLLCCSCNCCQDCNTYTCGQECSYVCLHCFCAPCHYGCDVGGCGVCCETGACCEACIHGCCHCCCGAMCGA